MEQQKNRAPLTTPRGMATRRLTVWCCSFLHITASTSVWTPLLQRQSCKVGDLEISAPNLILGLSFCSMPPSTWERQVENLHSRSRSGMLMELPHGLGQKGFPFLLGDWHTVFSAFWILVSDSKTPLQQGSHSLAESLASAVVCCLEKAQSRREGRGCSKGSAFSEKASEAKEIKFEWVLALFHFNLLALLIWSNFPQAPVTCKCPS